MQIHRSREWVGMKFLNSVLVVHVTICIVVFVALLIQFLVQPSPTVSQTKVFLFDSLRYNSNVTQAFIRPFCSARSVWFARNFSDTLTVYNLSVTRLLVRREINSSLLLGYGHNR